jgi:hypothetical protein
VKDDEEGGAREGSGNPLLVAAKKIKERGMFCSVLILASILPGFDSNI